jgi:hypothetical protein
VAERSRNQNEGYWVLAVWGGIFALGFAAFIYDLKPDDYAYNCALQNTCSDYKSQRDVCATAGSYTTCMSIKMGKENFSTAQSFCRDDGSLVYKPNHDPNKFACAVAWVKSFLR